MGPLVSCWTSIGRWLPPALLLAMCAVPSARAACPMPVTEDELLTTLDAAATAWSDLDVEGFRDRLDDAHAQLGCIDRVVSPSTAATVHRMVGLASFADRDSVAASMAFAAARAAAPETRFSTELVPPGHPIDVLFDAAPPIEEQLQELPATGTGWVDGAATTSRLVGLPAVVQLGDPMGTLVWSGWLDAAAPPPPVPVAPPTKVVTTATRAGPSAPLLLAASTTATGSIVLYAIAVSSARQHADPTTPYHELEPLRRRTNALVLASSGTAAAALGLGTVAFSRRGP